MKMKKNKKKVVRDLMEDIDYLSNNLDINLYYMTEAQIRQVIGRLDDLIDDIEER